MLHELCREHVPNLNFFCEALYRIRGPKDGKEIDGPARSSVMLEKVNTDRVKGNGNFSERAADA